MSKLASIIGRFPAQELAIHRLCNLDPDFNGVCEDYDEAARAMRHWDQAGDRQRSEEYRQIMRDLEAEIVTVLEAHGIKQSGRDAD